MRLLQCAIIGHSELTLQCIKNLDEQGHQILIVVSTNPSIIALCDELLIDTLDEQAKLRNYDFDYLIDPDCSQDSGNQDWTLIMPHLAQSGAGDENLRWLALSTEKTVELSSSLFDVTKRDHLSTSVDEQVIETFHQALLLLARSEQEHDFSHPERATENCLCEHNLFATKAESRAQKFNDVLVQWNKTEMSYPAHKTLVTLFEEVATQSGELIAVQFEGRDVTYNELNQRANVLAVTLRKTFEDFYGESLSADTIIALCMERGVGLLVGLLGILKAGAAYLPIEPDYPAERIAAMLQDAGSIALVTERCTHSELPGATPKIVIDLEDLQHPTLVANPPPINEPSDLAYVMYTSGSTGSAKGVMVEHRNVVASTFARFHAYKDSPGRFLLISSIAFDSSVAGIYWTLLSGGTLIIPKQDQADNVSTLASLIKDHQITHLLCIPSLYQLILKEDKKNLASLNTAIVAGESCQISVVNSHFEQLDQCALVNEYGPTEATVWSSYSILTPGKNHIGKPIANTQLHILDEDLNPVPPGQTGELYIAGPGVTRGYLGQESLTASVFLDNPFGPGRLYKTGDMVRFQSGELEYHGRIDGQVKINGYRIELGEIETKLKQLEDLDDVAVIAYGPEPGRQQLVAYCVAGMFKPEAAELTNFLGIYLMDYMIPKHYLFLEMLPRLANGKLDRQGLPAPDLTHNQACSEMPHSALESKLAAIWCQVLGLEQVGVADDFFQLGGHSLIAVRLIQLLNREFSMELTVRDLLRYPTIQELALWVAQHDTTEEQWPEINVQFELRHEPFPLTAVQSAYWMGRGDSFELGNIATHIYSEQDFEHLDVEHLERILNILINRHEMLRMIVLPSGQQKILEEVPFFKIQLQDLRDIGDSKCQLMDWREELSHQVLDVARWPLFDFRVSRFDNRVRLHLSMDALLFDALSVQVFLDEWARLYRDISTPMHPLTLSFRDYMACFQKLKEGNTHEQDKTYWLKRIDSLPLGPELPLATPPTCISQPRFERQTATIESRKWTKIKEFAQLHKVTPTSVLLAAFAAVLSRWSKNPHFLINLTIFNRFPLHDDVDRILGDFTSLELLEIGGNRRPKHFEGWVNQVHEQLWKDMEHRLVDGVEVQRELIKRRGREIIGRIAPVVFTSILNQPTEQARPLAFVADSFIEEVYAISQTPQVWLDNKAYEDNGGIVAEWDYVSGLFPQGMISDMHGAYCSLLESLAESSWSDRLPELLPLDQRRLIDATNDTHQNQPIHLLHEPFFHWAKSDPNLPAVVDSHGQLSYGKLADLSNKVAGTLMDYDAKPNQLVGVIMEKSRQQVIACMGILAAGAAYLPINACWPIARIEEVLKQSNVKVVLAQSKTLPRLKREGVTDRYHVLNVDQADSWPVESPPVSAVQVDDIAYVIFTSGTTGKPKGVVITHAAASNTLEAINEHFHINQQDRVLGLSDLAFDLSVWDIFGILSCGAALVLPDDDREKDPEHWIDLLLRHKISLWNTVPMLMQILVEHLSTFPSGADIPATLRVIMLSGDWIPPSLAKELKSMWPKSEVMSLGGATEGSIWSIWYPIEKIDPNWQSIPYGKALPNQKMYVLNTDLEYTPKLVIGDIYIGGVGVAKGYWQDTKKTRDRFINHPISGERLYKTGDLCYLREDGNLAILGRDDSQVKIGGHRIELGEIEHSLQAQPEVGEAVVLAPGKEKKRLLAFVSPQSNSSNELFTLQGRRSNAQCWTRITEQVQQQADTIPRSEEFGQILSYFDEMERAAPMIMLDGLNRLGLFNKIDEEYNLAEITTSAEIVPKYHKLLCQWLTRLVRFGYLSEQGDTWICIKTIEVGQCTAFFQDMRRVYGSSLPVLLDYFENCRDEHPRLFRGEIEALDLFMPNGTTAVMEHLYRTSDLAQYYNDIAGTAVAALVAEHAPDQTLNCLEVGAGIGGTTAGILPLLPADRTHYAYTDMSTFFFNRVKDEFTSYPFVEYGILDINKPFHFQGYEQHAYDIILAASVVHVAAHLEKALAHIRNALKPGGTLIILEGTDNCGLQMLNIGFIEGLSEFDDDRSHANLPLVSADRWVREFHAAGFGEVSVFGSEIQAQGLAQQHVFVAQSTSEVTLLDRAKLRQRLARLLPDYMIPNEYIALNRFPLNSNAKVDREQLLLHSEDISDRRHYVAPSTTVEKCLIESWEEVLNIDEVGTEDNFFELGGDSILAIQVVASARKSGLSITFRQLFNFPTVASLAPHVSLTEQAIPDNSGHLELSEDDMTAILSDLESGGD